MTDSIQRLIDATEAERLAELEYFRGLSAKKSLKEKVESGMAWYPIEITKAHYTLGEAIEVVIQRPAIKGSHSFKTGTGCQLSFLDQDGAQYSGTVSFVRRDTMGIILSKEVYDLKQVSRKTRASVERIYDERPYRVMKEALETAMSLRSGPAARLRELLYSATDEITHQEQAPASSGHYGLNPSQNQAIAGMLDSELVGIIHGPPGTGKTTTLARLIKELSHQEKQILVTAASNNAVDLLAERLQEIGLDVVRVGNVTRVSERAISLSLAERARGHQDWNHIKKIKIEAAEAKRQAEVFKRKYGPSQREQRKMLHKEARELNKWARDLERRITQSVLDGAQVICSTLIGLSHPDVSDMRFRTVVIDEASQALQAESWNAMLRAERIILAGDHKQLPPTVKSAEAQKLGLGVTMLDLLMGRISKSHLLTTQYRMHDQILAFSNREFYEGKLVSDTSVAERSLDDQPLVVIDTSGCGFDEARHYDSTSSHNPGEYFILEEHFRQNISKYEEQDIGIISPYVSQVKLIREKLESEDLFRGIDVTANSIDGFQGQERDVIYLSLVRSNDKGEIGFLSDARRINVALTRAKKKLVVIGDFSTLGRHYPYDKLLDLAESVNAYRSAWEYMSP